ncbi:hypothetical protein AVEN_50728-1, partial [Araneus ventricosus]
MARTTPELALPSPNFPTAGGTFDKFDLLLFATAKLKWSPVSDLEPSRPGSRDLTTDHRGLFIRVGILSADCDIRDRKMKHSTG